MSTTMLSRLRRAFGIACLVLGAGVASAHQPLRLDDRRTPIDLWPAVTMLADADHRLGPAEALQRRLEFVVPAAPHANLGTRRDTVWLRVPVEVPASEGGRWILDVDYASLDALELWVVSEGRLAQHHRLGDALLLAERPMPTASHAVALVLEPGARHELLLRVRTTSSMIVPLRLVGETAFHAEAARQQAVQGALAGLGLCLMLYAVVHAWTLRSAMFLHYGLTVAAITLFNYAFFGLAPQHLWPGSAWLTANAAPLCVLLAVFGGVRFIDEAMHTAQMSRTLALAQRAVASAALAGALAFGAGLLSYPAAQLAGTVLGVTAMVVTLPAALMRARRGDRAAWAVSAGWALYAAGAVTMALLLRGRLPHGGWTVYAFQAGATAEMLSWLVVLSLRVQQMRRSADRAQAEREVMRTLAETDALTGLPNRRGLHQRLERSVPHCAPERLGAVYMVDLDGFKAVNDRLGHDAGDLLLIAVAARLRRHVRAGDTVARLGGDEFVVCADALPNALEAQRLGEKLVQAMREPFSIAGRTCRIGLTAGYALAPMDGCDVDALLKLADAALYAGKAAGKGRVLGAHQMRADSEGFRASTLAVGERALG